MKTILLIGIAFFLQTTIALSQNAKYQVLASFGGTITKSRAYLSYFYKNEQPHYSPILDFQLIQKRKQKNGSVWLNFTIANAPLKLKYSLDNKLTYYDVNINNWHPRLGVGYLITSKKLYINHLMWETKHKKGLFIQFEPKFHIYVNRISKMNKTFLYSQNNINTKLEFISNAHNQYGISYGNNLYIGTNENAYFFISISNNLNMRSSTTIGSFTVNYNFLREDTFLVYNGGNGLNLSAGVRLLKF